MARPAQGRPTGRPPQPVPLAPPPRCRACQVELRSPGQVGWECECGAIVCTRAECISEYFKFVAGGEATRCLTCGQVL